MTVSADMITTVNGLLNSLSAADIAHGGTSLAGAISAERSIVDLNQLKGLTLDQAVANLSQQLAGGPRP